MGKGRKGRKGRKDRKDRKDSQERKGKVRRTGMKPATIIQYSRELVAT